MSRTRRIFFSEILSFILKLAPRNAVCPFRLKIDSLSHSVIKNGHNYAIPETYSSGFTLTGSKAPEILTQS